MLAELSGDEWDELCAFEELEPTGGLRDDLRAAQIVAAIFNNNPYREGKAIKVSDVFATLREPEKPRTLKSIKAVVERRRRWIAGYNAAVKAGTIRGSHGG